MIHGSFRAVSMRLPDGFYQSEFMHGSLSMGCSGTWISCFLSGHDISPPTTGMDRRLPHDLATGADAAFAGAPHPHRKTGPAKRHA